MYYDTAWGEKGNIERCEYNSKTIANYARRFPRGRWSFLGLGSEKKWCGTCSGRPDGSWDNFLQMIVNFSEPGHPIFRAFSASERGELRSKVHGKKSIHFNGSEENIELLLRTIISTKQLSVYGAIADLCKEPSEDSETSGNLKHLIIWGRWKFLLAPMPTNSNGETWCKTVSTDSNKCPMTRSHPNYALTLVWGLSKKDNVSSHFIQKKEIGCNVYAQNTRCLDAKRRLERKDGLSRIRESVQSWTLKKCRLEDWYSIEVLVESLFQDHTASWVRIVSGIDKYVTESMQTKEEEHGALGRPVAKARLRLKPAVTLSSVSIPVRDGKWIDIETQRSKSVIKCQKRHDPIATTWSNSPSWNWRSSSLWRRLERMQGENVRWCFAMVTQQFDIYSGKKEKNQEKVSMLLESKLFQPLPVPQSNTRTFRRYCYWSWVARQCTATRWIYWVHLPRRNASEMNSIVRSGLIPGGRSLKRGWQSVFFTITNPMEDNNGMEETPCDLTKPRIAPYKNTWKPPQNTVFWCNWKLAQERGLQFNQTRSHAIVLYNTLPAVCIEKALWKRRRSSTKRYGIWILIIFLSPHLRTFDLWALGGPCKFPCTSLTTLSFIDIPPVDWMSKSCGGFSLVLHGLRDTKLTRFAFAGIIRLGFAIGEPSLEVVSWRPFDMALCFPIESERKLLKWLQENMVSTYLIWIFGSKSILSNNQSSATLWVLDTCLIVGLRPLIIILMTASLSSKMNNWDSPWEECVLVGT